MPSIKHNMERISRLLSNRLTQRGLLTMCVQDYKTKISKSQFERLPVEAKQAILCAISDVEALKATALTCSSLYLAFMDAEEMITTQVVLNEIDIDILPEAIAALKSKYVLMPLSVWVDIKAFTLEHLESRLPTPKRWVLSEALPLSNLYKQIDYFAIDFAKTALAARGPIFSPPSREEMNRIKRAFCRFEIYRNLFSRRDPLGYFNQAFTFFSRFSVWENEQLACIHEYLFRVVSPAFNEIAEHDVEWGEFEIKPVGKLEYDRIQYILSSGLQKLHQIAIADKYEDRYALIYSKYPQSKQFLSQGLKIAYLNSNIRPFSHHVLDNGNPFVIKSFYKDPDSGPTDAYSWAYRGEWQMGEFIASTARGFLREWGYVMWDRTRLDEMGVLDHAWQLSSSFSKKQEKQEAHRPVKRMSMYDSWKRRQLIHMSGGSGWWSELDENRVEWLKGWSPWDDEEKRKKCPLCIGRVFCAPHRLTLRIGRSLMG